MVDIVSLKEQTRPVVIWGTKTAAKICCRVLKKFYITIVAAGDNDIQNIGKKLYGIPVLSLQEIRKMYPDALVVIGNFSPNATDSIIRQLQAENKRFSFLEFGQIEYLYELRYLNRTIQDSGKLYRIINHVRYNGDKAWKRQINKGVMTEYRYVIRDDKAEDLKAHLSGIYGVKNMVLIADKGHINELKCVLDDLEALDNIGHMIVALDYRDTFEKDDLVYLASKLFYVICDETAPKSFLEYLEKNGLNTVTNAVSEEVFSQRNSKKKTVLSEKIIVESMIAYTGCGQDNDRCISELKAQPAYIVQLFNGLANQVLMYLFGRFMEEESERIVVFDDTILSLDITDEEENRRRIHRWTKAYTWEETCTGVGETRKRNSFYHFKRAEIAEVFDAPIHLLSDYFDDRTWRVYLEKIKREHTCKYAQSFPLCHVLLEYGVDVKIIKDNLLPKEFLPVDNCCCIDPYIWEKTYEKYSITDFLAHSRENLYFMGGWSDGRVEDWLFRNRKWVEKQLSFRLKWNETNRMYAEMIKNSDGIMLHIRRGDFVYYKKSASTEYFCKAIQLTAHLNEYREKKYFVFSDDLAWCREHKRELGLEEVRDNVVFVSGNEGISSYMDMYLMSLGKVVIPTLGSTFGYVSMLVSHTMEKCIDMPRYFYNMEHGMAPDVEFITID